MTREQIARYQAESVKRANLPPVREIYGPVHSRLLKQALDLINNADEAREKSQPPG